MKKSLNPLVELMIVIFIAFVLSTILVILLTTVVGSFGNLEAWSGYLNFIGGAVFGLIVGSKAKGIRSSK